MGNPYLTEWGETYDRTMFVGPGGNSAQAIEDAIAGGVIEIVFSPGVHTLDRTLVIDARFPGVTIRGDSAERTTLSVANVRSLALVDDPGNAVMSARAIADATYVTALTVTAVPGADRLTLASTAGLAAGDTLRIVGHNNPALEQNLISSGANIALTELAHVASVGAPTVLSSAIYQQHTPTNGGVGAACSVQRVTPVRSLSIFGLTLIGPPGLNVAVGLLVDGGTGLEVDDVRCQGFTRAGVELRGGTRDHRVRNLRSLGANNSLLLSDSSMAGIWTDLSCSIDGDRDNALGIPRALVQFTNRSSSISLSDFRLSRGCIGISLLGGQQLRFESGEITDIDSTDIPIRNPLYAGFKFGVGVDMGVGPVADNENGYSVHFSGIHLSNCRHAQTADVNSTFWIHDVSESSVQGIEICNSGPVTLNGKTMSGFRTQDVSVNRSGVRVAGCEYAWYESGINSCPTEDVVMTAVPGSGASANIGFYLDIPGGTWGPKIRRLQAINFANPILFGPAALATPDYTFSIGSIELGGPEWWGNVVALNATGGAVVSGHVCRLDPTAPAGVRRVVNCGGPARACLAVSSSTIGNGQLAMTCPLPSSRAYVQVVAGAVALGDFLVASATAGFAQVDNAPADPETIIGVALEVKGAPAGLLLIGPRS